MAEEDRITMSQKESNRLYVIRQVIDKAINQELAAKSLNLSDRQVRRIVRNVKKEGTVGICHKFRGKRAHNRIADKIRNKATTLCRETYKEFGPTLASEKLLTVHKIKVSNETLRGWFQQEHIPYKGRKKRPHRQWRKRKAHRGEMVQMDGSHHDWFEGRGPVCVLMGYIDDATGHAYARFYEYEGTVASHGQFQAVYQALRFAPERLFGQALDVQVNGQTNHR